MLSMWLALCMLLLAWQGTAVPANGDTYMARLDSRGLAAMLRISGDEFGGFEQDVNGYSVVRENGVYTYANGESHPHICHPGPLVGK